MTTGLQSVLHDKNKDSLNNASNQNNLAGRGASKQSSFQDHQSLNSNSELTRIRKKRKSHKARNRALAVLGVLVAIFAIVGGAFALYLHSLDSAMGFKSQEDKDSMRAAMLKTNPVEDKSQAFYMLVLGSDARVNDATSRSDVMILLRVDPTNGKITMVSIPRDTKVEIEGHGTQKINAAYAFGGAAGAVTAVSQFAGVPILHYAEVHFDELEQLVDDLGGVWVDVPVSNNQTGASNTGQKLNSGYQLLNGSQALAFARERYGYTRGDFQRADNQKLVAQAIVKQVLDQQPTVAGHHSGIGWLYNHRSFRFRHCFLGSAIPKHRRNVLFGNRAFHYADHRWCFLHHYRARQMGRNDGPC